MSLTRSTRRSSAVHTAKPLLVRGPRLLFVNVFADRTPFPKSPAAPRDAVLVGRVRREWPWGIVVFSDLHANGPSATDLDHAVVVGNYATIVAHAAADVDAVATVEIWIGRPPATTTCVYDAEFKTPSGKVIVGDIAMDETTLIDTQAAGTNTVYTARVYLTDINGQHTMSLWLTPRA